MNCTRTYLQETVSNIDDRRYIQQNCLCIASVVASLLSQMYFIVSDYNVRDFLCLAESDSILVAIYVHDYVLNWGPTVARTQNWNLDSGPELFYFVFLLRCQQKGFEIFSALNRVCVRSYVFTCTRTLVHVLFCLHIFVPPRRNVRGVWDFFVALYSFLPSLVFFFFSMSSVHQLPCALSTILKS